MGSCFLTGTEFVFQDEKVLETGCTTMWIYLQLNMVKTVNSMCILPKLKKNFKSQNTKMVNKWNYTYL